MKPDGYLPRKGDVVVLHAVLSYDVEQNDTLFHARVLNGQETVVDTVYIPVDAIVDIHSLRFDVGDFVSTPAGPGVVRALKDGWAWVEQTDDMRGTNTFATWQAQILMPGPVARTPYDRLSGPDGEAITVDGAGNFVAAEPEF